jgi:hypothetical protein
MNLDLNPSDHPDAELIEDARMAAVTNWEEAFVEAIRDRVRRFPTMELSGMQRDKLEQIRCGR